MNALSDFKERIESEFPSTIETEELNSLLTTIHNQSEEINKLKKELNSRRQSKIGKIDIQEDEVLAAKNKKTKVK